MNQPTTESIRTPAQRLGDDAAQYLPEIRRLDVCAV